jgi:Protein of unknown function (DUF3352)
MLMRTVIRTLLALTAVAAVVAACGGTTTPKGAAGAAGTDGLAAASMPASTVAFIDANADIDSPAWQAALALGSKFPGFAEVEKSFRDGLSSEKVDFATDIKPWLGDEMAVGLLAIDIAGDEPKPQWVAYVAITDAAKAEASLTADDSDLDPTGTEYKGFKEFVDASDGEPLKAAIGADALLIASDSEGLHAAIDAHEGAPSLADSALFGEAMADLAADNLLVGFADGAKIAQLAGLALPGLAGGLGPDGAAALPEAELENAIRDLQALRAMTFSLGADDDGVRFRAVTLVDEAKAAELGVTDGEVTLDAQVPADALAFVGGRVGDKALRAAITQMTAEPEAKEGIAQFESMLGVSLADDIVPMLSGEAGLYVAPGATVKAGLLLKPADPAAAAMTLGKITTGAGAAGIAFGPLSDGAEGQIGSVQEMDVSWRRDGDVIAVGVGTGGAAPAGGADERLLELRRAAGTPDSLASLLFVDVAGLVAFARTTGEEIPAEAAANLAPLGGLIAWGATDGGRSTTDAFLQIR